VTFFAWGAKCLGGFGWIVWQIGFVFEIELLILTLELVLLYDRERGCVCQFEAAAGG